MIDEGVRYQLVDHIEVARTGLFVEATEQTLGIFPDVAARIRWSDSVDPAAVFWETLSVPLSTGTLRFLDLVLL